MVEGSQGRIVADCRNRLRREEWYRERGVREAVRKEYEPELAAARGLKQVLVYLKMRRELRRELEALAPERASYLRTS